MGKIVFRSGLAVVALLLVAAVTAFIAVTRSDLKPYIERYGAEALGRQVTVDHARIGWRGGMTIVLDNLHVANAKDAPAIPGNGNMIDVWHADAVIALGPLLHGVVRYQHLNLDGVEVFLERDAAGVGNWRAPGETGPAPPPALRGGLAVAPKDRTQFPTLIDAHITNSLFRYRTSSGAILRIDVEDITVRAADDAAPAHLVLTGRYNGVAARLVADTDSFNVMRDAVKPFGISLSIISGDNRLDFKGSMMQPLDFSGIAGDLHIASPAAETLFSAFGLKGVPGGRLELAAQLDKKDDHWAFNDGSGYYLHTRWKGAITLDEGARHQPDRLGLDLHFDRIDLDAMQDHPHDIHAPSFLDMDLRPDAHPDTLLDAHVVADTLIAGKTRFARPDVAVSIKNGEKDVDVRHIALGQGRLAARTAFIAGPSGTRVEASARLDSMDIGTLIAATGGQSRMVAGRIDGAAAFVASGNTVRKAMPHMDGAVILRSGRAVVMRRLVEAAETNVRALVAADRDMVPVTCFSAGLQIKDGIGRIAPLGLGTPVADFTGGGTVDVAAGTIDAVLRSHAVHRSLLALNVPLRISGRIGDPHVAPALGADVDRGDANALQMSLARSLPEGQGGCVYNRGR